MPNHVANRLTVQAAPERVAEVFAAISSAGDADQDAKLIDFDKIIPYPEPYKSLDAAAHEYEKQHPGDWANRPKDGFNSGGYEWCCNNWGTKWNAYSTKRVDEATIFFETAWSSPVPVVHKLAEMFPDVTFLLVSCDEDYLREDAGELLICRGDREYIDTVSGVFAARLRAELYGDEWDASEFMDSQD